MLVSHQYMCSVYSKYQVFTISISNRSSITINLCSGRAAVVGGTKKELANVWERSAAWLLLHCNRCMCKTVDRSDISIKLLILRGKYDRYRYVCSHWLVGFTITSSAVKGLYYTRVWTLCILNGGGRLKAFIFPSFVGGISFRPHDVWGCMIIFISVYEIQ